MTNEGENVTKTEANFWQYLHVEALSMQNSESL